MTSRGGRNHQRDEFYQLAKTGQDLCEGDVEPQHREQREGDDRDRAADLQRPFLPGPCQQRLVAGQHRGRVVGNDGVAAVHVTRSTGDRRCRMRSVSRSVIDTVTMIINKMALTSV